MTLAGGIGGQVLGRPLAFPRPAGEGKGEGENVRRLAVCESIGRFRPFSLTSILSRWARRPRALRLREVRARDRSVEQDDLPIEAETVLVGTIQADDQVIGRGSHVFSFPASRRLDPATPI